MAYNDLTKKDAGELQAMLAEERSALHALAVKHSIGQLKTTHEMRAARLRIAHLMTALNALNAKK